MSGRPLSGSQYVELALVMLGFNLIGLCLCIRFASGLVRSGTAVMTFYVLIIPSALSSAVVLFGAMRAYAIYQGQLLGGTVDLGGPVVVFLLILLSASRLAPTRVSLTMVVRAEGDDDEPRIGRGAITLEAGVFSQRREFSRSGEAVFAAVDRALLTETVTFIPDVPGYSKQPIRARVTGDAFTMHFESRALTHSGVGGTCTLCPHAGRSITHCRKRRQQ